METERKVRMIFWCVMPVTNDMPQAIFPNIDTGRNNVSSFSQMKSQRRKLLGRFFICACSQVYITAGFQWIPALITHTQSDTHICTFISDIILSKSQRGDLINLIMLIPCFIWRKRTNFFLHRQTCSTDVLYLYPAFSSMYDSYKAQLKTYCDWQIKRRTAQQPSHHFLELKIRQKALLSL